MRKLLQCLAMLGLLAGPALAHGTLIVESDEPAWVHINGNRVGLTPQIGKWVGHGTHRLSLVNAATGETLHSMVTIPFGKNVTHKITGSFPGKVMSFAPEQRIYSVEEEVPALIGYRGFRELEYGETRFVEEHRAFAPAPQVYRVERDELRRVRNGSVAHLDDDEILVTETPEYIPQAPRAFVAVDRYEPDHFGGVICDEITHERTER